MLWLLAVMLSAVLLFLNITGIIIFPLWVVVVPIVLWIFFKWFVFVCFIINFVFGIKTKK